MRCGSVYAPPLVARGEAVGRAGRVVGESQSEDGCRRSQEVRSTAVTGEYGAGSAQS